MIKLIIFPGYYVPHVGGVEKYADDFAKYLSEDKNYEIYVFAPNIPKYKSFEIKYNNVKVYRYPAFDIRPNYPVPNLFTITFWRMFLKMYKIDFDIVMTKTRFFSNSLLGLIFAKFRIHKKKLIHVEHGSAFVNVESKITNKIAYLYDKTIGALIFKKSDCVVAISRAVYNFITENFIKDKSKIRLLPRGLEIEEIESIKPNKDINKKFKNKVKLCFVGRLFKWKGVENTISAYKSLSDKLRKKTVLIIVGYGEDLNRLKKLSGEYLNNGIYFTGKKKFKDAIGIMKTADIYVHSSYKGGGLSTSLLQAMCCGRAIVASPYEGADEVITDGKTGVLLKGNSPREIKEGILKLINNKKLREKYGRNAQKFIEKNFNWRNSVNKYKEVFEEVLRNK